MPRAKKTVTVRLDADLLEWFRRNRGYQTRINAVLRAYMNAEVGHRTTELIRTCPLQHLSCRLLRNSCDTFRRGRSRRFHRALRLATTYG